jgi:hypothetical protein
MRVRLARSPACSAADDVDNQVLVHQLLIHL